MESIKFFGGKLRNINKLRRWLSTRRTVSGRCLGFVGRRWFVCSGTDDFIKTNDRVVYAALLKEIIIFNSAGFPYRAEKNNSCATCCNKLFINALMRRSAEPAVLIL